MPTPESASAAAYGGQMGGGMPYGNAPPGGAPGQIGFGVSLNIVHVVRLCDLSLFYNLQHI